EQPRVSNLEGASDGSPSEEPPPNNDLPGAAQGYETRRDEATTCNPGMRLVDGEYCSVLAHRCIEPFTDSSGRCKRYAAGVRCFPPVIALRFCIDEFEYPNRWGEKPTVMVTFEQAQQACQSEGKRLCTAREWTLACEGPERFPYPNGLERDATACNIDRPHRFPDVTALDNPATRDRELDRLDQRSPSGSKPNCVSRYGVQDLVGNVDEWVVPDGPEEAAGFGAKTALKGGYFGPVRARCRPSTPSHGPTFRFYQVGFRCCREATGADDGVGR
ncbi:MAG TPA: SUMF1/EgtB/PvdO family nonheme iron enzyme, partial [Polyangiaceae bacterium]